MHAPGGVLCARRKAALVLGSKRRERREYIEVGEERECTGERVCGIVREDAREEERVGDVGQSEGKIVGEKSGKQVENV